MNLEHVATAAGLIVALAACAASIDPPTAHAAPASPAWPAPWQDMPEAATGDFTPPHFEPPSASHCHRAPTTREVPGGGREPQDSSWRLRKEHGAAGAEMPAGDALTALERSAKSASPSAHDKTAAGAAPLAQALREFAPWPQPQPQPTRQRSPLVTAGVVDDNADFGEYLAYRQRNAGQPVRERDISERYLLEVTDADGRPVHDAEVAVQRPGVTEPVMWARTDTAGRVWLHPRAFIAPSFDNADRVLGVAVRKGATQARATLLRGQSQALQVRLGAGGLGSVKQRPRLDLVFMVDATGSMGDEINKLKASMRAMSEQIAQLPGQPDICYGLVAYRDRGDAFITRTHDLTDDLGAFQNLLSRVQAQGGGDTPEALNEALHEVVHGLSWRVDAARMVVQIGRASCRERVFKDV